MNRVQPRLGLAAHMGTVALLVLSSGAWSPPAHARSEEAPAPASSVVKREAKAKAKDEGLSDADLERMLSTLATSDGEARQSAAAAIEALGQDSVTAIGKKLGELRKATGPQVAAALKSARAGEGGGSELHDALVKTKEDGPGYTTALSIVVLLQALAHIGTTPAARQLIRVAVDHGGAFRPEVARHVKTLGDKAVPALIETRKESSSELRHWAYSQLEGMGKRVPGDAVQMKDNQILSDVLRAFANVHDMDALPVLLSFVNSDRIQVRAAARDALNQFGQDAIWKLREAYSNVTGKPAPEGWPAAQVAKELFSAYDKLRLQEVYGLLEEGLTKFKDGKIEEAAADFDKVLARQPMLDRRGETVPAYVAYAQKVEDTDPPKSLALFRKAARLWPESPRASQLEAEIAYLEGKELLGRGVADVEPFKRALTLDPGHEKARAELNRLESNVEERQERVRAFAAAGAVVIVALVGILLFGGRRRAARRAART
jgi:tetratricopeptide (TPR) repeat protein